MISKKMMTFLLAGTLVVGGVSLGNNVFATQSKNQPKSIQQKAEVVSELTAKPGTQEGVISCGVAPDFETQEGVISCGVAPDFETQEGVVFCGVAPESEKDMVTITNEVDMYNVVLDYFISLDEALNSDMKYIAVNFEKNISDENKEKVIENLKKNNVDILEGDLEYLKEQGLSDEYGNLYGILLSISDIKMESENKIIINGSKYRSGIGSISTQVTVNNDNGTWKIEASTPELAS